MGTAEGAWRWRRGALGRVLDVDLRRPEVEIHVFVTDSGYWWGQLLFAIGGAGFDARRPRQRPFWRSIAMAPRKAHSTRGSGPS